MTRIAMLSLLITWAGATIALSELRSFRRLPLTDRLAPFVPGGEQVAPRAIAADRSVRAVMGPMATDLGSRLARTFGTGDALSLLLERIGSPLSPAQFRTRQVAVMAVALALGGAVALALSPPTPIAVLLVVGAPLGSFLSIEQRLAKAAQRHQQQAFAELPVVAEQLGMFISAGMSLTGALARVAQRSNGSCAAELRRVNARINQGVTERQALGEWAEVNGLPEVGRLVSVLLLHQQTTDLGSLISSEARSVRREAQRRLIERIERRNEQVWIPVTVATLVPGVIFLSIPFTDALRGFGAL